MNVDLLDPYCLIEELNILITIRLENSYIWING
jgi:hypothetical protein